VATGYAPEGGGRLEEIKSRHMANVVLKQAGRPKAF
jgi:hypothetical protein